MLSVSLKCLQLRFLDLFMILPLPDKSILIVLRWMWKIWRFIWMLCDSNGDTHDSNYKSCVPHSFNNWVNAMASVSGMSWYLSNSSWCNRSDVWQYFTKDGSRNVICTLCKGKFAYHGGTSNLQDHLQRSHSVVYVRDSGQPKIDSISLALNCKQSVQLSGCPESLHVLATLLYFHYWAL